jgi:hypothetical protein
MEAPQLTLRRYLGDGVYAGFDGLQIWLWIERDGEKQFIALESGTLAALTRFTHDLNEYFKHPEKKAPDQL